MIVIGVDPGSVRTGFALVEFKGSATRYISSGTISLDSEAAIAQRLQSLYQDFSALIAKYQPQALALESLFFARNAQSALKLGYARGVLLMTAAHFNLEIYEYSPAEVKNSLVGHGRAQKDQVARMIKLLLKFPKNFEFSSTDQSDALAIALTHVQTWKHKGLKKNDRASFWQNSV